MNKSTLTIEQHAVVGAKLKTAYEIIEAVDFLLEQTYLASKIRQERAQIAVALCKIDILRSELEIKLFNENKESYRVDTYFGPTQNPDPLAIKAIA